VFVATGGTGGGLSAAIIAGGVSSAASDAAEQVLTTGSIDPTEVVEQGVVGGATGGLFHGAGRLAAGLRSGAAAEGRVAAACTANSFVAGTAVLLADGTHKRIEDVQPGDRVVATDPTTGRTQARPVADVIVGHGQKQLVEITLTAPAAGGGRAAWGGRAAGKLTATEGHPFWAADLHRWVDAKDLRPGNLLRTSAGTYVQVGAVKRFAQVLTVYNLTVDGIHTYHVAAGTADVLVHNCAAASGGSAPKPLIIGENMDRVEAYAAAVGGHAYRPWPVDPPNFNLSMRRNERMIRDAVRAGRDIIDIGPDFARRSAGRDPSPFYGMERRVTTGYANYTRVWDRTGRLSGGVPGFDP
jgi:hypothetical protein